MNATKHVRQLTAIIEREDEGYVALCPELDRASQGDTIEDARLNLAEAVELFFELASPSEIAERFHPEVYITRIEVTVAAALDALSAGFEPASSVSLGIHPEG